MGTICLGRTTGSGWGPQSSLRSAPWLWRLGTLHSIAQERDREPLCDQDVSDIAAIRFEPVASSRKYANPLAQRSCGTRTGDRGVVQPAGHDQIADTPCGFDAEVAFSPALGALHFRSNKPEQTDGLAIRGNRVTVDHPDLVGFNRIRC